MLKKVFIKNIIPLIISLTFGYYIYTKYLITINTNNKQTEISKINKNKTYSFINYKKDNALISIISALKSKNTVLLIGSSELRTKPTKYNARPDLFFEKNKKKISVVAIGHDGNQCLSIYTQLLALNNYIKNAKISIIISTGWFEGHCAYGTSLDRFLEYNNEKFIRKIYNDTTIPNKFKNYLSKYIYNNYNDLIFPSILYKDIICKYKSDIFIGNKITMLPLLEYYKYNNDNDTISLINEELIFNYDIKLNNNNKINWDSLLTNSKKYQDSISTNNTWGISNDYYETRINGHISYEKINNIDRNIELKDFKMLLKLFKYYKVKASFIIQPLNPFAYGNLKDYKPIINEITNEIDKNGYPYKNMFVYDTLKYEKGTLTDIMHFGEYGWFKVDKFLIDTYEK